MRCEQPNSQLKGGSYPIFVEEDYKAKVLVYNLDNPNSQGREVKRCPTIDHSATVHTCYVPRGVLCSNVAAST